MVISPGFTIWGTEKQFEKETLHEKFYMNEKIHYYF